MLAVAAALTLAVSPARTTLRAPASRTIQISNLGSDQIAVDVAWRPLGGGAPHGWLTVAPGRLVLRRGARGFVTVRAGTGASPGDHDVLVLVTGRNAGSEHVAVRVRAGVRVRIRVPGRLVHRLTPTGVRTRRRALLVAVTNRGNVAEQLRGRVRVTLLARGRVISRLRSRTFREVYPGTRAIVVLPYAGRTRGPVTAVVRVASSERKYRLVL
jgi:hypothetical protein